MNYRETMQTLKEMGTAQNRKIYARHGVGRAMYGVSYANQGKLHGKIKVDHGLARRLWGSGNHDARILATMIADPEQMPVRELNAWARDLDNYVVTDAFSRLAARTPHARGRMSVWIKSRREWLGRAGWLLLAGLAANLESEDIYFDEYIAQIEERIHSAPNRARDAMNMALIAIGSRNAKLEKKAVAAARRIGPVEVDHGETGCKTADAVEYIRKTRAHRKQKAAKEAKRTGNRSGAPARA